MLQAFFRGGCWVGDARQCGHGFEQEGLLARARCLRWSCRSDSGTKKGCLGMDTPRQPGDHPVMVQSVSDMELAAELAPRLYTVEEYNTMARAGIFAPNERVELLDGQVIPMPPMGLAHRSIMIRMGERIHAALGKHAMISTQLPVVISERSEPEPDFAILRRREDFYASGGPEVADILAVVEVTDTSVKRDRVKKFQLYAQARIPEYWIVDVRDALAIDVFREPHDLGYAVCTSFKRGDTVAFAAFPDVRFKVEELVG